MNERISDRIEPGPHPTLCRTFQMRVLNWMLYTFGTTVAQDVSERCHRFLEEGLELVQSLGCTASEAHQLVDYVFGRPVGKPPQELGGTAVCLAALAHAAGLDVEIAGDVELSRNWKNAQKIREKWLTKPKHSPLPSTDDAGAGAWNALVEAKERAEEEARLMRAVVEAGDDLYASLVGQCSTEYQSESVCTYAQVSNAYRGQKLIYGEGEESKHVTPHEVPHIVINEQAHGQE